MRFQTLAIAALVAVLLSGCFGRQTYENPIAVDEQCGIVQTTAF